MSAGAKVTIAVVILFTVLLGVYYGFGGLARPGGDSGIQPGPGPETESAAPAASPPEATPRRAERPAPQVEPVRGGILSDTVSRAREDLAGESGAPAASAPPAAVPTAPPAVPAAAQGPLSSPSSDTQWQRPPAVQPLGFNEPRTTAAGGRAAPPAAAPAGSEIYVIEEDDSMWTIAADWLGQGARWPEIASLNPQINPHRLDVGQKILVPSRGARAAKGDKPAAPSASRQEPGSAGWVGSGLEYSVKAGDTLSTIAKAYYGEASKWQAIYEANKQLIGADPDRLKLGMKLRMPGR